MTIGTFFTNIVLTIDFLDMLLRMTTPILLAALGAVIFDRSGIVNIGIEGIMLLSALTGVLISAGAQSWILGLLCAVLCSIFVSLLYGYFVLKLKTPLTLCSLAINALGAGGTIFILQLVTGEKGNTASLASISIPTIVIPFIKDIPIVGAILSGHNIITYLAFISIFLVKFLLYKTPLGLRMRAVGENPDAARSVGINEHKIKYTALILSGILIGMSGAFMSMGYMNYFVRDMTAGRGFIALAAEITGQATPIGTALSSLLFGLMGSIGTALQSLNIPGELLSIIPYVSTLLALLIYNMHKKRQMKKVYLVCHPKRNKLVIK